MECGKRKDYMGQRALHEHQRGRDLGVGRHDRHPALELVERLDLVRLLLEVLADHRQQHGTEAILGQVGCGYELWHRLAS